MVKGLFETHVQVSHLEDAIEFYTKVLGLEFAHKDENRSIAFLWIGKRKNPCLDCGSRKKIYRPDILLLRLIKKTF
ncbi:VOC family protein [Chryseobacterium indoltheticum]|uniref:VOC family protein n=1 Tax=Chryseobacterium indoltheticum TaxID=254 RepID=UPI003F4974F6